MITTGSATRPLLLVGVLAACAGPTPQPSAVEAELTSVAPPDAATSEAPQRPDPEIARLLRATARAHALTVKHAVAGRTVSRKEGIALIKEKAEHDLPKDVLAAQGELLGALALIPADYDFVAGMYSMLEQNVAGFYDPDQDTMFLIDDLDRGARHETLAHELVHALQDQHYDLGARLRYRRGQLDRITAAATLAEGDAMSAMLDVSHGSAFRFTARAVHLMMVAGVAFSESGGTTPRVLQSSLISPYSDGFRFVQQLRKRGGWQEVDRVWRAPPETTEQLLHLDKYDKREPAILVPELPIKTLGSGWQPMDSDAMGEQTLRIVLEQWAIKAVAREGAAGWGGDRYLVLRRSATADATDYVVGWHIRFDTEADAIAAHDLVRRKLTSSCLERAELGPIAHKRKGGDVAIVVGPYRRNQSGRRVAVPSSASCKQSLSWLDEILAR